jgi:RNA polymerase sigma-70 factor (ECF subfamily)
MDGEQPRDAELLARMRAGDEEAFTLLYRRRQGGVYRYALLMSGSRAVAEDVTQDVFLALIEEGRQYDEKRGTVAAYLYGIARKKVLRQREREAVAAADPADEAADPLDSLVRDESLQEVWAAVRLLPAHYREAVVFCELHEMSYDEASAALGCSVGTVRSRLHRGRALLAERLRSTGRARRARGDAHPAGSCV